MMPNYINADCMKELKHIPDKYFDLAIVDPPYFSGPEKRKFYGKEISKLGIKRPSYNLVDTWDVPTKEYFDELFRISKHQIIWGVNYFVDIYDFGPGRIIWDKCNGESSYSDAEIAFCSMHDSVRVFRYMWNGMMQGKSIREGHIMQGNKYLNEIRIHPTQKPVNLYKWILLKYANKGMKILDTHVGSASSLIAFEEMGYEYLGIEKDKQMFEESANRIASARSQINFFGEIDVI